MKRLFTQILSFYLLLPTLALAQEQNLEGPKQGHTNQNKFRQLYNEFSTPNDYRTASGAPGTAYYQQRADYVMDIKIDDETQRLYGEETITYTNNSPDTLEKIFYHLYYNAFQPGSMMDVRSRTIEDPDSRVGDRISKLNEDEIGSRARSIASLRRAKLKENRVQNKKDSLTDFPLD